MLTSSDAEKLELLKFQRFLYEQMQKKIYYWSFSDVNIIRCSKKRHHGNFSDVNIIRCRKTGIIEFCLMLISSDAEKTTTIELYLFKFCLMVISSGAEKPEFLNFLWCLYKQMQKNRYHRILSDVNIIRCRKTDITEFCLMLISSDAEKQLSINFVWC